MRIIEGRLRLSASDVANFLVCQQLTQLDLGAEAFYDRKLHGVERFPVDPMMVTTASARPRVR